MNFSEDIDIYFSTGISKWILNWWRVRYGTKLKTIGLLRVKRIPYSSIVIGNNCRFLNRPTSNDIGINRPCIITTQMKKASIIIGDNCGFSGTVIGSFKSIIFGNNVMCGANTLITDSDWHPTDPRSGTPKSIIIEDNVWLGVNVTILKGVRIGANSVIGVFFAYYLLNLFAIGYFGSFGNTDTQISALLSVPGEGITSNLIDVITSNRSRLLSISIASFVSNPIYGMGAYSGGGFLDSNTVSSQHSFLLDTLAYYGCFGFFIIFVYYKLLITSYKIFTNRNSSKFLFDKRLSIGYFSALLPAFVLSVFNPYFMSSSYDFLIMFIGGFLTRRLNTIQNTKKLSIPQDLKD